MPSEWSSTVLDKAKAASKHKPSSKIHYSRDPFQGPYYGPENGPKVRLPNLDLTVALKTSLSCPTVSQDAQHFKLTPHHFKRAPLPAMPSRCCSMPWRNFWLQGPNSRTILGTKNRAISAAITMVLHSLACSSEAAMKGDTSFIVYGGTCGGSRSLAVSQTRKAARIVISNRKLTRAWWQGSPPDN